MTETPGRNALTGSRSPFLRHGATQPVDWLPWGEEAFEQARRSNRPVLLDIGAVWCHWCHVMDRESYEDSETARLINERFVPVKVDRDERPDVDARYQRAVQLLTGQGGWPLTAFLTPDGDVFYGGTYFPPQDAMGRPSFRRVLSEIARVWTEEPARAAENAHGINKRLEEFAAAEATPGEASPTLIETALEELAGSFDFRHGGFGRAPKFPNAGGLDLLLDDWLDAGTEWAGRIVTETLVAMARGGIYDHLGGGFHRYSTDARWIIPHFEKMAYDQGVLLDTFARASARVDDPVVTRAAHGVVDHYLDIAPGLVRAGGYPASQDADLGPDDDGDYWTWTEAEVRKALGNDEGLVRIARMRWGMDDPATSMHLDPERHVLYLATDAAVIAEKLDRDAAEVGSSLATIERLLKAARDQRPRPYVDETLYTGWIALVAIGHIAAARYLGRNDAGESALRALDRIWQEGYDAERGVTHRLGDRDAPETLDDQAHTARALLDAFELTQDQSWLDRAASVLRRMLSRFSDDSGGLRDRPRDATSSIAVLEREHLPISDSPMPSGNGSAALALLRLHALSGEDAWRDAGHAILRAFAASVPRFAGSAATYVKAVAWAVQPVTTVVVVEGLDGPLLPTALQTYRPRTVVRRLSPAAPTAGVPPEIQAMLTGDAPRAYVCAGHVCAPPVATAAGLAGLLADFRG
jgi:uncharacterized protein